MSLCLNSDTSDLVGQFLKAVIPHLPSTWMSLDFVAAVSLLRLGLSVSIIVADLCDTFFGDLDILAGEELARLEKGSSTYRNSEAVVSLSENQLDLRSRLLGPRALSSCAISPPRWWPWRWSCCARRISEPRDFSRWVCGKYHRGVLTTHDQTEIDIF